MSKPSRRLCQKRLFALTLLVVLALMRTSSGQAQTWAGARPDPVLWQVVAIDQTGEPDFPYGREDIAGDGLSTFSAVEAGADLRTVYASSESMRLWLRAYLAGTAAPGASQRAFFFIDSDARSGTGGPAQGMALDEALGDDPTSGGYERAVSVRGNGNVLGVFEWNATMRAWTELNDARPADARAEVGASIDPLGIGSAQHGYVQLELSHALSGLDQSCGGNLFVRLLADGPAMRTFADDAPEEVPCIASEDPSGVPVVLWPESCDSDAQCPADGRCLSGGCVFAYECQRAADCPSGYSCSDNRCVRVVSGTCDEEADCDGLVCENASCVACSESGASACRSGLVCSPDGSCVDPDNPGGAGGGSGTEPPGKVRGGAFSCALRLEAGGALRSQGASAGVESTEHATAWSLALVVLGLVLTRMRSRRRVRPERNHSQRRPL